MTKIRQIYRFFCFFLALAPMPSDMYGWPGVDINLPEKTQKTIDTILEKVDTFNENAKKIAEKIDQKTIDKFLSGVEIFNNNVHNATEKIETFNNNVKVWINTWNNTVDVLKETNRISEKGINSLIKDPKVQSVLDLATDLKNGGFEKRILNTWDRSLNMITLKLIGSISVTAGLVIAYQLLTAKETDEGGVEGQKKRNDSRLKRFARAVLPPIIATALVVGGFAVIYKARNIAAAIS